MTAGRGRQKMEIRAHKAEVTQRADDHPVVGKDRVPRLRPDDERDEERQEQQEQKAGLMLATRNAIHTQPGNHIVRHNPVAMRP